MYMADKYHMQQAAIHTHEYLHCHLRAPALVKGKICFASHDNGCLWLLIDSINVNASCAGKEQGTMSKPSRSFNVAATPPYEENIITQDCDKCHMSDQSRIAPPLPGQANKVILPANCQD